ncbi:alcohol dehydrogenase class IV [Novosphingobium sp. SG751A]|uniref:maleylacetate reductase n=1 Tax=Novosphingobium sp. SG751A TaxID=2587000 RepID=UPI0020A65728|nr:maleylacetate reductase [Novosphingobium sp. SG751A]NOW48889.1 alcohol dehydrogenase class IV [Novosphingobium sp. SG751A]
MMQPFVHETAACHVRFGHGSLAALPDVLAGMNCQRGVLITTPRQGSALNGLGHGAEGRAVVGSIPLARMHTPVDVTEEALVEVRAFGADCLVALGGGSAIGLGKALALRTGLPQIAIPTTYAGSEMTPVLGQTENGRKTTLRNPIVQPKAVIYDVDLTLSMPADVSAASGMNAMAHAVEGLYARNANPLVRLMAQDAVRAMAAALPAIVADGQDREARAQALYAAWLCGIVLASAGMAIHHKLCHTLGGTFGLPHAQTHAVVLPHALAYNASHVPEAMDALACALNTDDPVAALHGLLRGLPIPQSLGALGMPHDGVARATALALEDAYWNPRPLEEAPLRALLEQAWQGPGAVGASA